MICKAERVSRKPTPINTLPLFFFLEDQAKRRNLDNSGLSVAPKYESA